jgi:hypothetical protein
VGPKQSTLAIAEEYAKSDAVLSTKTAVSVSASFNWDHSNKYQRLCREHIPTIEKYKEMAIVDGGVSSTPQTCQHSIARLSPQLYS